MVWCLLRRLFYTRCAHPPNRPKTPTRERASSARGRAGVLLRRIPSPAAHYLQSPAPALRGRAVSAAYGRGISCAVSGASRPRPLRGLLRVAFAGCFCGGWLRLALPQGAGQTWLAMFHSPPYYGQPLGGRVPQGGAHSLPPSARPALSFAGCFCVPCSLLLRPVCASLAGLLVAARIRGHHAALQAARGLPRSPRPLRSRALGRFAPRRALSPPAPWARKRAPWLLRAAFAGCLGGLLLLDAWVGCYIRGRHGWALSRCRPRKRGRTLFRAPLVFRLHVREDYLSLLVYSAVLRGQFVCRRSFARAFALPILAALRAAGAAYGTRQLFAAAADAAAADKNP